jgi:hypothetical protein
MASQRYFPVSAISFLTGISVTAEINATANVIPALGHLSEQPLQVHVHEYQFFQKNHFSSSIVRF